MLSMLEVLAAEVARIRSVERATEACLARQAEKEAAQRQQEDDEFNEQISNTFKSVVTMGYLLIFMLPFGIVGEISRHEYQQATQLIMAEGVSYFSLVFTRWTGRNKGWLKPPTKLSRWLSLSGFLFFILRHTLLRGIPPATTARTRAGSESKQNAP